MEWCPPLQGSVTVSKRHRKGFGGSQVLDFRGLMTGNSNSGCILERPPALRLRSGLWRGRDAVGTGERSRWGPDPPRVPRMPSLVLHLGLGAMLVPTNHAASGRKWGTMSGDTEGLWGQTCWPPGASPGSVEEPLRPPSDGLKGSPLGLSTYLKGHSSRQHLSAPSAHLP